MVAPVFARGAVGLLFPIVGLPILAAVACRAPDPAEPAPETRFVSLLRLIEEQGRRGGEPSTIPVWSLGDDYRPVVRRQSAEPAVVESVPGGEECAVHFAIGLHENAWTMGGGVEFRLSLRRPGAAADEPIFSERVVPESYERPRWLDREVRLPDVGAGPFSLVFETAADPEGGRLEPRSGWASPYVVCRAPGAGIEEPRRPPIVLVSIDTLRRDRLGVYGYGGGTSPVLDALAGESLVFEDCFSTASYTVPSHASMFTGLYPDQHGAGHGSPEAPLAEERVTLAEVLRHAGYRTVAFTAGGMMGRRLGFAQGFDEWTERHKAGLGSVLPEVFDAIGRERERPLFLFLHTYDVHGPYREPDDDPIVPAEAPALAAAEWERLLAVPQMKYQRLERFRGLEEVGAAYDAGVRSVDAQLGRLFDHLESIGLYDDALIVVTSDHGETLFERRRYIGHGYTLNDEEVRVPLIVRYPGASERGRRAGIVELVDLFALIAEAAGVDPSAVEAGGGRRPGLARGETSHTGARYARTQRWKVISATNRAWEAKAGKFGERADRFDSGWQVYDLAADPDERRNLFDEGSSGDGGRLPREVRELIQALREAGEPGLGPGERTPPLDAEEARALRSLGYLQ